MEGDPAPGPATTVGEGTMVVATLGDSITAGTPRWDPDPQVRDDIDDPDRRSQWQYWAARELDGVRFTNCGVNRQRTDQIARRLRRCARGAEALVVQGGINDLAQGRTPEQAASNLRDMVRRGQQLGLRVLLADVLPWNAGGERYAGDIVVLNRLIRTIAEEEGATLVPFNAAIRHPDAPQAMRGDWTIDGSHPSVEGHRRLAGAFVDAWPAT